MKNAINGFCAILTLAIVLTAFLPGIGAWAAPLKIGVTPGSLADSVNVAADEARKAGLDVQVIEFTDWTTPNVALDAGDIDLNYFEHQAFLDHAVKERGYRIESVAVGLLSNIGLFSKKVKSFADLREGASVGVADDPINQGRGLLLLQKAGLIGLRDGVGVNGTLNDVVSNPKKLRFVEVPGPQLARAIDDLDLVEGYPGSLIYAGQTALARSALLYSGVDDAYYAIRFVARKRRSREDDERIRRFVRIYQTSETVRKRILDFFVGDKRLYALPWLAR